MQKIRLACYDCLYGSCQWLILLSVVVLPGFGGAILRAEQIVYDDVLQNSWVDNYSWATVYPTNSPVHTGSSSISVSSAGYQGLYFHHTAMDASLFTNITFWINGGSGGQHVNVQATSNGVAQAAVSLAPLPANSWRQEKVSLASLGVATLTTFDGFWLQVQSPGVTPTFYVDDISLSTNSVTTGGTNAPVFIMVDASSNRHAISPLIYGVAFASSNQLSDLNLPLNRSGGNNETRYNWQISAHNLDADWYFESYPDANATPGSSADDFVANSKASGAEPMITVPMIGWAPKLGSGRDIIWSYSVAKYGAQKSVDQYRTDAGNGIASSSGIAITNNDPNDANFPTNSAFEQTYVQHLINRWGSSTNGGVPYFIMDNEHSIWQSTHQDIHPVGPTMQEIRDKIFDYASMVKSNDPNALVCGPEEWGWNGYLYSGYDQQWASHNNWNPANFPDRNANGGMDYMPWLLDQLHQHETSTGVRLLDYFTLHCYPQESNVGGDAIDSATELLRNQSTRVFWDPNYVDPSWINNIIMLIPRMKNWVTNYYPGTKIGITEYNWGAEPSINGATAQADILGIFGRENLDLATRWTMPDASTPTYKAIKIYRNYDGNKSTFGDTSIQTTVPDPDNLSAFSAVRTADGALTLMVINKDINNSTPVVANLANFNATGTAQRWQLTSGNVITRLTDVSFANSVLKDTVPSQSITLYVLPGVSSFSLKTDTATAPGQLTLWLNGHAGLAYQLQASADLVHWSAVATNTLMSNSFPFLVSTTNTTMQFYRGLWSH